MVLPRALPYCSKEAKTRAPKGTQPPRDQAKAHSVEVPEQDGIKLLLESARIGLSRLKHLWVDAGYQGRGRRWAEEVLDLSVEVVRKPPKPAPEKVTCSPGPGSGTRRAKRSIGKLSCRREGTWLCPVDGWWSAPSRG